jgi:hypothetical protein
MFDRFLGFVTLWQLPVHTIGRLIKSFDWQFLVSFAKGWRCPTVMNCTSLQAMKGVWRFIRLPHLMSLPSGLQVYRLDELSFVSF